MIGRHPQLFYATYGMRPRNRAAIVRPSTEIVIEGFPRSGNTFAVFAFQSAQSRNVKVAHHLHSQAQVLRAARLGIPTCVLLRNPIDAAKSLALMFDGISFSRALKLYRGFYDDIYPHRHHFVVATFEEVTTDIAQTIRRINSRFGTNFEQFTDSPAARAQVNALIDKSGRWTPQEMKSTGLARPSLEKENLRAVMPLDAEEHLLQDVDDLYGLYLELADRSSE